MTNLLSLGQTLEAIAGCSNDREVWDRYGWVYATDGDERDAVFWLSDHDAEHDDARVEAFAAQHALSTYLEAATFADVLEVQKRQRPLSTLDDYAQALAYYSEYDAFAQVAGIDEALDQASVEDQQAARVRGVGPGIFATFDLALVQCPASMVKDAARIVAAVLDVPVGQELAWCRALPMDLGRDLERMRAAAIAAPFQAAGIALEIRGYRAFPWMDTPTLA
ncbi:hypothetical protein ABE571_18335 [Stenotrophomonas sp. TWI273]|uniref:DUF7716 domain-containing protein n=1 Tax=Stenotrophomonas sp. TWI273 TaxID=3136774 RepID=UPI0032091493